ncbi:hypothetical protein NC651_007409 [Populus alba x Populus x berolinensis]|nr:hypothetical protein NC651_007409 [Populus alba x Populus x berolinensis]
MHDSRFCCCLFLFLNTFLVTLTPLRSNSLGINSYDLESNSDSKLHALEK